jgi:hypothetical protein
VLTDGSRALARSRAFVQRAREILRDHRSPYVEAFTGVAEGLIAWVSDDFTSAAKAFARAEEVFRDQCIGVGYELGATRTLFARALAHFGRIDRIAPYAGAPLRDAVRRRDRLTEANLRSTAAVLTWLARGDVAAAEHEVTGAAEALSNRSFQLAHLYWLAARFSIDCYRDTPERALAYLDEHRGAIAKALLDRGQWTRVILLHMDARAYLGAAARAESPSRKREWIVAAAQRARQLASENLPVANAYASLIEARIAALEGDRAAAIERLTSATEAFDRLGTLLHAAAARHACGTLIGGHEGARLSAQGLATFRSQGIAEPDRFARIYAPSFESV